MNERSNNLRSLDPKDVESLGDSCMPNDASASKPIIERLQAWVNFVEKDTETQVQEYLEQVDAGQSGE